MKLTYPARFCPPQMFEMTKASKGLLDLLFEKDARKIANYVIEQIGNPEEIRPSKLLDWCKNYRNLWSPVLVKTDVTLKLHEKIALVLLSRVVPEKDLLYRLMSQVANPWISLFSVWHAIGRKEYVVSTGLVQKLKQTKLKGYPAESLKLPYDAFYVDLQNYGHFGGIETEGCMIVELEKSFGIALITTGEHQFPRMLDVALGPFSLDVALEKAIERYEENELLVENVHGFSKPWRELFSYITNVILYATMPDAEKQYKYYDSEYKKLKQRLNKLPKNSKKREKINAQLKRTNSQGCFYLGGSIPVDRRYETQGSETNKPGRTLSVRTLVSGHWRDQPCGKGNQDRKRIWIQPFWRGPEGAPITQRIHKLKG